MAVTQTSKVQEDVWTPHVAVSAIACAGSGSIGRTVS